MNIILCGFPASGKSSCGLRAAELLPRSFVETDRIIEATEGMGCREIVITHGAAYFRACEDSAIASLHATKNSIISLGGGSLDKATNLAFLKPLGLIVYLHATPEILCKRLLHKEKLHSHFDPKDPKSSLLTMWDKRHPVYTQAADFTIEVDKHTIEHIAEQICSIARSQYGN